MKKLCCPNCRDNDIVEYVTKTEENFVEIDENGERKPDNEERSTSVDCTKVVCNTCGHWSDYLNTFIVDV